MNKIDENSFASIMLGMADNFRDTITPEGLVMRFDMLKDFSIEQVEAASKKILMTRKYLRMPPVAEFIEAMSNEPKIEDQALVMANRIIANVRHNGAGFFPDNIDKTSEHLMMTRWPYHRWASEVLESEMKWWVKEFCESYRSIVNADERVMIEPSDKVKELTSGMFNTI